MPESKINRRKYLKYAGAAISIGAIAAAGYGISQYHQPTRPTTPGPTTPSPTVTTPAPEKKKVKIGGTKPLTGIAAYFGINESNGCNLCSKRDRP